MSSMPSTDIIYKFQSQICEDRTFEKSPRNVRLLKFLIEKAIAKEDVNEYIVGLELFEQNYHPESNDSKVRVYMYNLRKKLEEYYDVSGKNDELKFVLNKGQYNLEFDFNPNTNSGQSEKKRFYAPLLGGNKLNISQAILIATIVVLVLFIANTTRQGTYKSEDCWKPFFEKNAGNVCIVADQVMVYQFKNGEKIPRIIFGINNENDFIEHIRNHAEDTVQLADYTLFSKMAPYSVKRLTEWFLDNNSQYSLRLETGFQTDELRDNNILYVGQHKTMSTSKALFLKNSKKFDVSERMGGFKVLTDGKEEKFVAHSNDNIRTEYAMVSFMKLESGNHALYFVSNNDIGVMATVNNFTKKEWLQDFYKNLPANSKYFNALFEVSGTGRTEIDCKLIEFEVVN